MGTKQIPSEATMPDDLDPDSLPAVSPPSPGLGDHAMRERLAEELFGVKDSGTRIGRYPVLDSIGSGGMGEVHAAWDEKLRRKIAIKLMKTGARDSGHEQNRLVREAQALAKLSHPNVVQVYEVGKHGDDVYLAMELVEGTSLLEWQQDEQHPWSAILDVYVQAGRGLAAAHRAKLVHGDFKPANVLVGLDERVRVADFGLAQGPELPSGSDPSQPRLDSAEPLPPQSATRVKTVAGTPAYMAPEQFRGEATNILSDQFSFCVALFEALFGQRPFDVEALRSGELASPLPRGKGRAPWWVRRALRRGLELEPTSRWESMDALLAALDRRMWRRRAGGLALVLAAAGGVGLSLWDRGEATQCLQPANAPGKTWSTENKSDVEAAILATAEQDVFDGLDGVLGDYVESWDGVRAEACGLDVGTSQRDRLLQCLDRRAEMFARVIETLPAVVSEDLGRTQGLLEALGQAEECRWAGEPLPASIRREIDEAEVEAAAGHLEESLKRIDELLATAGVEEHPAARAEALATRGQVLWRKDDFDRAQSTLTEAIVTGAGADHVEAELEALTTLMRLAIDEQQDVELAHRWSVSLHAAVARAGRPPLREADYLSMLGMLESLRGEHGEAIERHRAALELQAWALGTESHPLLDRTRLRLANALADRGEYGESLALFRQVLVEQRRRLGRHHPQVAVVLFDQAMSAFALGELDLARSALEQALEIEQASLGPDSTAAAKTELQLSQVRLALGDFEGARDGAAHAWQVLDAKLPREHSDRLAALELLANIAMATESFAEALRLHRRLERELPDDAPDLPSVWHNIAWLLCRVEECDGARPWAERARAAIATSPGQERGEQQHLLELTVENTLAFVARSEGKLEDARVHTMRVREEAPQLSDSNPESVRELLEESHQLDEYLAGSEASSAPADSPQRVPP